MNLIVDHVIKNYDNTVLDNINLDLKEPGVYLIAGPNGSGKTTLLEIIAGLRKADSGEVLISGYKAGSLEAKKELGFLCQQNGLRKTIKLKEEMALIKDIFQIEVNDIDYLKRFNLEEYYNNKTTTLSGGTKRRFLTAILFLAQQNIIMLDEPVSGLDTYSRDEIWNTIREYGKEHIVIVSDHYLNQARLYSDTIILLDNGRIVAKDTFENIRKKCPYEKLIKVRHNNVAPIKQIIEELGGTSEVKVSGTVHNFYIRNNVDQIQNKVKDLKVSVHDLDLEDIYFYLTGKKSHSEEIM
ncbi:ABC transporter ATP-binding protein [Anaerococcus sp. mt242]|uniref:ATP-binding cassette domain-containing protein n=1 Tax=Anaerococcus sp. mt242 TaxID=2661917 RepID=UPI0019340F06|nr:ABC transporter ATP-binding protein [Anaerococcus sp. mt242]MBM0046642.1 ABC transporter ATP-binding protein [Anaerococcus sp. mt242]